MLLAQAVFAPNLQPAMPAGDAAALAAVEPDAIGYIGFGNIEMGPKLVPIDGVQPSETAAQDSSYRLVCPLLPLTRPLTRPMAQTLVDFALSDKGRQVVEESDWVPAR